MKIQNVSYQNNHLYQALGLSKSVLKTIDLLRDNKKTVGFAESCTGGMLSSSFTQVSGVSEVFVGSVVSYANSVKENILNVSGQTLANHGAVSAPCAEEMALGVLKNLKSDVAIAITGIAGPKGGTDLKPVGTVFIAVAGTNAANGFSTQIFHHDFSRVTKNDSLVTTTRQDIQQLACMAALEHLALLIKN